MTSRKFVSFCLAVLLCPLLVAAAPTDPSFRGEPAAAGALAVPFPAGLTSAPGVEWSHAVVEIYGDGALLHREEREVRRPAAGESGLVAVLATRPADAAHLAGMIERGRVRVEVDLQVDGKRGVRTSGRHLLERPVPASAASAPRLLDLRYPRQAVSADTPALEAVTAAGQDCSASIPCRNECLIDRFDCIDSGVCFPERNCDYCDDVYTSCTEDCPPCVCVDPKSVTTETRTSLFSVTATGFHLCLVDYPTQFNELFQEVTKTFREDEVEVTTNCDGSTSEVILSTSFFYVTCFENTQIQCFNPTPTYPPIC